MKRNKRYLIWLALAFFIGWGLRLFVFETRTIDTKAMLPAVTPGEHVFIAKIFRLHRGDIVFYQSPLLQQSKSDREMLARNELCMGRIVGCPGDTVAFIGGKLRVNGKILFRPAYSVSDSDYSIVVPKKDLRISFTSAESRKPYALILQKALAEEAPKESLENIAAYTFQEHYYWILTDDRKQGPDSRHLGLIPESDIRGKLIWRWGR